MDYLITCPYCLGKYRQGRPFSHKEVHFRMETVFEESELNDEGYTRSELEALPNNNQKAKLMEQLEKREPFQWKDDKVYSDFWAEYGHTSEISSGVDAPESNGGWQAYQRPILNPTDSHDQKYLLVQNSSNSDYFIYDTDGFVRGVVDRFGKETYRRVCPDCHNPLPPGYGKFPTKLISIIGVTSSGKTVYISQLLKHIEEYGARAGIRIHPTSDHEQNYMLANPVEPGKPLPNTTMSGLLSQPMFCNLKVGDGNYTVVIYDIAGEDCQNADNLVKYGRFVTQSDGIMLLVDPSQLGIGGSDSELQDKAKAATPQTVANTIYNAFGSLSGKCKIPVALCISKSDKFDSGLPDVARHDISGMKNASTGRWEPKFNAKEYNELQESIMTMLECSADVLLSDLDNDFEHFNVFMFSATGCSVVKREYEGEMRKFTSGNPSPRRIAEPILWMFQKFGYIKADMPIRLPYPRPFPLYREVIRKGLFRSKVEQVPLTPEEIEEYKQKYHYEATC